MVRTFSLPAEHNLMTTVKFEPSARYWCMTTLTPDYDHISRLDDELLGTRCEPNLDKDQVQNCVLFLGLLQEQAH
jgi:hypothetical protein